ncbi:MAG: hypothetical protein OHK0019_34250 [Saprospiraceae bacterium]
MMSTNNAMPNDTANGPKKLVISSLSIFFNVEKVEKVERVEKVKGVKF